MSEGDRASRGRSSSEPGVPASEAHVVAPQAGGERGWTLRDPMRLVRNDRAQASAQLQRSIKAWRKPLPGAGAQPKIFLAKKKSGGEDWASDPLIVAKMAKLQLPTAGSVRFVPKCINKNGKLQIDRATTTAGPRKGEDGWLDVEGRIWIRNYAHAGYPDHWDVQINGGADYINVTLLGEMMTKDDQNKDHAPKPGDGFGAGGKK